MSTPKKRAVARTPAQRARAERKAAERQAEKELATTTARSRAEQQQLAQIINLQIAGMTLEQIGAEIGMSSGDLDALIMRNASRYIKTQPQLRVYVRGWISEKMTKMIEANWGDAIGPDIDRRLPNQDRVIRILDSLRKMHGTDAPAQSEVKIDAAPEAIDAMVQALAAKEGLGYDVNVFDDVVDADVVEDATVAAIEMQERAAAEMDADAEGVSGNEGEDL